MGQGLQISCQKNWNIGILKSQREMSRSIWVSAYILLLFLDEICGVHFHPFEATLITTFL